MFNKDLKNRKTQRTILSYQNANIKEVKLDFTHTGFDYDTKQQFNITILFN